MIIEFFVENFRSIKTRQAINLTKMNGDEVAENSFDLTEPLNLSLLRSAAFYGANASGKSNLISALQTMRKIVMTSAKDTQRGESLPVVPFRLSKETSEAPTEFEIVFVENNIKYQYGFSLTQDKIKEEWLFAFPKGRPQRWFIRAFDEKKNQYVWDFSSYFQGQKQLWKDATKHNSLFLSTAVLLNSEQLKPVFDWFSSRLKIASISGWDDEFTIKLCQNNKEKKEVLNFLKSADLDIDDIKLVSTKLDDNFFPKEFPEQLKNTFLEKLKDHELIDVKTVHKRDDGEDVFFDLKDESDGTRKLFSFAGPWIDSLKHGKVLFIDELHDSLHPAIVNFLVKLFNNKNSNPLNAQLIFTTHETSILDQKVFRRDQIWFCNKEKDQSTTIYPLTDFSPRKGTENLEKSYLSGRYGALPLISNLDYYGE